MAAANLSTSLSSTPYGAYLKLAEGIEELSTDAANAHALIAATFADRHSQLIAILCARTAKAQAILEAEYNAKSCSDEQYAATLMMIEDIHAAFHAEATAKRDADFALAEAAIKARVDASIAKFNLTKECYFAVDRISTIAQVIELVNGLHPTLRTADEITDRLISIVNAAASRISITFAIETLFPLIHHSKFWNG